MKNIILIAGLSILAVTASAQVSVKPHINKDGTFVQGHVRSAPNDTLNDNYSTKGNTNPYTGQQGTVDPYKPSFETVPNGNQRCFIASNGQYRCQ